MKAFWTSKNITVIHRNVRFVRSRAFKPPVKKLEKNLEPIDGQFVNQPTPSWQWIKPEKKVKKTEDELLQEVFFGKPSISPTRLDDDVIPVVPG